MRTRSQYLSLLLVVAGCFSLQAATADNTIVTVETSRGTFNVELFDDDTPVTVNNFLNYVNRGDFDGSFIHRSVPGFIVQAGGFIYDPVTGNADPIPTDPPIVNEFRFSNVRGTLAMAKLGGNPDSATSQWFVNLADNSSNLDNQNGGFTVFGQVIDGGMSVVDDIASLPITNFGGTFSEVPTVNFTGTLVEENLVRLLSVSAIADADGDGIADENDADDDNDGTPDEQDTFPFDPTETTDFDEDGIGDNADPDDDNDNVPDVTDQFPNDATESSDNDLDGTGDNADLDDDNDELPDLYESSNGLNPFVDDAEEDLDGDGISNLLEFTSGTDPSNPASFDNCVNESVSGAQAIDSPYSNARLLAFANPASNNNQQSLIRLINTTGSDTNVEIYGIDDSGQASRLDAVSLLLLADESVQITSQDLENGNELKGLTGRLCDSTGKWQLEIRSSQPIEAMSFIRTPDGFLTNLSEETPVDTGVNQVYFTNPASNTNQQTFLRITNRSDQVGNIRITGVDDEGVASPGELTLSLGALSSVQFTAQDLESGNSQKGLQGQLGDGAGKWRLSVASELDLSVMSLIRTADGFLTNLSSLVPASDSQTHRIGFVIPADNLERTTFLRIINVDEQPGTLTIQAFDDDGNPAPGESISVDLEGNAAVQMTSADLENGNPAKNIFGALGTGSGNYQLTVESSLTLKVMNLVRTPDGFLTNLSSTAPERDGVQDVLIFNPASNSNQRSSMRIVNLADQSGTITISAVDDTGSPAPGGEVSATIAANAALNLTAEDLENGAQAISGALGSGTGKWHLTVSSDTDIQVFSLLETPTGFLTNLSLPSSAP